MGLGSHSIDVSSDFNTVAGSHVSIFVNANDPIKNCHILLEPKKETNSSAVVCKATLSILLWRGLFVAVQRRVDSVQDMLRQSRELAARQLLAISMWSA